MKNLQPKSCVFRKKVVSLRRENKKIRIMTFEDIIKED